MVFLASWAFLADGALHPRADFIAGKTRCLAMCELGCGTDSKNPASSCVAISAPLAPPWVDTFNDADQETFKYKWCRLKYQMAVVATESNDGFLQTIKFPSSGTNSGMFKEIDHLDWIAPTCNKTTAPSCRSVQTRSTTSLDVGFKRWFYHEGNNCRNLVDGATCRMDCLSTCLEWCQCGWDGGAEASYEEGKFRRQVYNATTKERTCRQVYAFDKMCTCSHGSPVNSVACLMHGKEQCASCDPGYKLHENVCLVHECICLNGTPVSSETCSEHNANECSSCDRNYHLGGENGKQCDANQCTCDHGMPVSSVECLVHGGTKCKESMCEPAFHFELDECKANACFCRHGSPMPSGQCVTHGEHACARCDGGYHLDEAHEKYCEPNVCQCRYGAAAASENCTAHLANHCHICNIGFHLSRNKDKCEENVCECDHGMPVARQDCFVHGETKCRENSCNRGYHLESDNCTANICRCDHGTPVVRQDCSVHDAMKCAQNSCSTGYHFESNDCKANVCQCIHGTAVVGKNCTTHMENDCQKCETGFHLSRNNKECEVNVCTCTHGTAVTGRACTTHGAEKCHRCNQGFHKHNDACTGVTATFIKANVECRSEDVHLGYASNLEACAQKCLRKPGCEYLIYGKGEKADRCYWEKTRNMHCVEGWAYDHYNFYRAERIQCVDNVLDAACINCGGNDGKNCKASFGGGICKSGYCAGVCRLEHGIEYYGRDLPGGKTRVLHWEACNGLCVLREECLFWTWNNGDCYLKRADAGWRFSVTHISGSRWCRSTAMQGEECYSSCGQQSGPCDFFCGRGHKCCRKNWKGGEKGCLASEGGAHRHECVTF